MRLNDILFPSVVNRSKVFSGGGGGGSTASSDSDMATKNAMATNAAKAWNRYVDAYIPNVETPYIQDIISDPTSRENAVMGTVNADVAKNAAPVFKPGTGAIDVPSSFTPAKVQADAQVAGKQAVGTQRLAAMQGIVDMGRGKQSTVDTGLESLAKTNTADALSRAESDWNSKNSWSNAAGSAAGALANTAANWNTPTPSNTPTATTPTSATQTPALKIGG
jgi:hypothetical protein